MQFHRLLRFRIRTLLILTAILAVWLTLYIRSVHEQKVAVQAVREYGGWVRYDFQFPSGQFFHKDFDSKAKSWAPTLVLDQLGMDSFHDVVQVNLNYSEDSGKRQENKNISDEALRYLPSFPNLRVLLLSESQATDASMHYLADLRKLEYLYMWDVAEVSDKGIAYLRPLKHLKYIHINSSQITDESLRVFGDLHNLKGLCLQFNQLTDQGLTYLSNLQKLEDLWVCGQDDWENEITDEGLEILASQHDLKALGVQWTKVTEQGLSKFKKTFPKCRVVN